METIDKNVIIITNAERAINYHWEDEAKQLCDVSVVSCDSIERLRNEYTFPVGYLSEGMTLIRNPYRRNIFLDLTKSEEVLFKEKIEFTGLILAHLGAKSYAVDVEIENIDTVEWDANGNVKFKGVSLNSDVAKNEERRLIKKYSNKKTFTQKEISKKKALEIAEDTGLINESDIYSLIHNPNLETTEVSTELSSEYNSRLDAALQIKAMTGLLKVSSSFNKAVSSRMTVRMKMSFSMK